MNLLKILAFWSIVILIKIVCVLSTKFPRRSRFIPESISRLSSVNENHRFAFDYKSHDFNRPKFPLIHFKNVVETTLKHAQNQVISLEGSNKQVEFSGFQEGSNKQVEFSGFQEGSNKQVEFSGFQEGSNKQVEFSGFQDLKTETQKTRTKTTNSKSQIVHEISFKRYQDVQVGILKQKSKERINDTDQDEKFTKTKRAAGLSKIVKENIIRSLGNTNMNLNQRSLLLTLANQIILTDKRKIHRPARIETYVAKTPLMSLPGKQAKYYILGSRAYKDKDRGRFIPKVHSIRFEEFGRHIKDNLHFPFGAPARAKWDQIFTGIFKPKNDKNFKHLRLTNEVHTCNVLQGLTDKMTVRERKFFKSICHKVLLRLNALQTVDRINLPQDFLAQSKIVLQLCWKTHGPFLNVAKQNAKFSRFHRDVWHKCRNVLHKIREKKSMEKNKFPVLYFMSEKKGKYNPLSSLDRLHLFTRNFSGKSYSGYKRRLTSNGKVVRKIFKEDSRRKSQEQKALVGSLGMWGEMRQGLFRGVDFVYSMLNRFFSLLKQTIQKLFGQIIKNIYQKERKKFNGIPRGTRTNIVAHLGRQHLTIETNLIKPRRKNLILIKYNIQILPKPLQTTKKKRDSFSWFLHLCRKLQSKEYKKSEMKNKEHNLNTLSRLRTNSAMSSPYQKPGTKDYKKTSGKTASQSDFQHTKLKRKRKIIPSIAFEVMNMNMNEELNSVLGKNIMHSADPKWNHVKYSPSGGIRYLRRGNVMVGNEETPAARKKYIVQTFDGLMKETLKAIVKKLEKGDHKTGMNEMNDKRLLKLDGKHAMTSSGTGRRKRRAIHRDDVHHYSKRLRPYSHENRLSNEIPFHRKKKISTGKYTDIGAIDPFKYSWKNIKDLPDGEADVLGGKLLDLMQLVRERNKNNRVNDLELGQHVEPSVTSTEGENGNKRHHSKHPTLADRKLLHNIELLTFLVLGGHGRGSHDQWETRKEEAHRSNDPFNKLHAKLYPDRKGKIKGKVIEGHPKHLLRKRAAQQLDIHDLQNLRRLSSKKGADLDDDFLDSFMRTEVKHNTFPERWKSLKHQLNLLDKQMSKTKDKYTSIQKKIKHLIKEGEVLAEKAVKTIGRSETDEASARNSLHKLETEREQIEKKIKEEEEKRENIEEQFMRSGITGKVNNLKDELAHEEYRLHGIDSMEDLGLEPLSQKHVTHIINNGGSFLDSDDDMMDIEPRNELKSIHIPTVSLKSDDELHRVDSILDTLLENRVKRSSEFGERQKEGKHDIAIPQDQVAENDILSQSKGFQENSETESRKNIRKKGTLRVNDKCKAGVYNGVQSKDRDEPDLKSSKVIKRAVLKKDIDKIYNSTTLLNKLSINQRGNIWVGSKHDERTQINTKPEDMSGGREKAERNDAKKQDANVLSNNKQYKDKKLNDDIDLSQSSKKDTFSKEVATAQEPPEGDTQIGTQDQRETKKREKSGYDDKLNGHRIHDKKVQETMRKFLDLQAAMNEATKDLNSMFERTKEAREKQWAKEDEERKEREKKEGIFLGNLMKEIDNEVSWLKNMKGVEIKHEKDFLPEAEEDLKKRHEDERKWMDHTE